jgi:hypothetical protein
MLNRFSDREAAIRCFGRGADAGSDLAAREREYAARQTSSG